MIPFNKPYVTGKEFDYIREAVASGKISGDGIFSRKCHEFFENRYGFLRAFLTSSCTDALEMSALLLDLQEGDEVILPSYTFVSTANAFVLRGAKLVFADSDVATPNISIEQIERLIGPKTKAIVPVHYAGVSCDMDPILEMARAKNIAIIEDAAHSVDSYYKGRPLGGMGQFGTFSFHETKNIIAGEGGLLAVNDPSYVKRAEIVREKGTNRSALFRGEVDKYGWVDIGSSFLPSDVTAAFLFAQLEAINLIQAKRKTLWERYYEGLGSLALSGKVKLPFIPNYATRNGHLFYMICSSLDQRAKLLAFLKDSGIHATFHYLPLHQSKFYLDKHDGRSLPMADHYADCLLRLPLFYELTNEQVDYILVKIHEFYRDV